MPDDLDPLASQELFESMYRGADGNPAAIPWAELSPNSFIASWLHNHPVAQGKALVVGCGLGDDAEALAGRGWSVTAFDLAPTAIAWCKDRFPSTTVNYRVADIFDLPTQWSGGFSLVVEVLTIQSLPPTVQAEAIRHVAGLISSRGSLLVSTFLRTRPPGNGPPWPLAREDLDEYAAAGLDEVSFTTRPSSWDGHDLCEVEYVAPGKPAEAQPRLAPGT